MFKIPARGARKLISVLIPSRKRMDLLKKAIDSLINTASDTSWIEILLRLDEDDKETLDRIHELPFDKVDISIIIGKRLGGYKDLHIYINELSALSKGEFLFLFNDDSYVQSQSWDKVIGKYVGKVVCLKPNKESINTFPILSRQIYDLFGYFSLSAHNDTWVQYISKKAGVEVDIGDVFEILHDRFDKTENNNDIIYQEREEARKTTRQAYADTKKKRDSDVKTLKRFLKNNDE